MGLGRTRAEKSSHQIDLCQDTNGPRSLGITVSSHFEPIRIGQIGVGGSNGENDRVGFHDEFEKHFTDLSLDIARLISDGDLQGKELATSYMTYRQSNVYLGETREIDKGEREDVRRVDFETDRERGDS